VPAHAPFPLQASSLVPFWPSLQVAPCGLFVTSQPLPLGVEPIQLVFEAA
jgi:hypothetical protein